MAAMTRSGRCCWMKWFESTRRCSAPGQAATTWACNFWMNCRKSSPIGPVGRRAESKIDPVLSVFQDQVLFLKHNLNAKAIAHLESELVTLSTGVAGLITAMERSIDRANTFMQNFSEQKSLTSDS